MGISSEHSRGIFEQLSQECQPGVQCVIENHDAWVNSAEVEREVDAAVRERIARSPRMAGVMQRIRQQRAALSAIAVTIPTRARTAS
jgi:hypothetical protein